ncbi:hypothetical protein [Vulcanisaeta distributa]|uniref:hypothetical protein n=1 Tax=Vulcanisaeta distributa TaxID=164451 RepID=UPI001FB4D54C|nr:hypothetical protein [Vulcanisaeta distributa]
MARLSDAVKLRQLIGLAGVGYRPKGRSSVIIGGVKMTVRVRDGYVELVAVHKDGAEITKVLESLKALGGINASVTPWGGGGMSAVRVRQGEVMRHDWVRAVVCGKLTEMLREAVGNGDDGRSRSINGAMLGSAAKPLPPRI